MSSPIVLDFGPSWVENGPWSSDDEIQWRVIVPIWHDASNITKQTDSIANITRQLSLSVW